MKKTAKNTSKKRTKKQGMTISEMKKDLLLTPEKMMENAIKKSKDSVEKAQEEVVLKGDTIEEQMENMGDNEMSSLLNDLRDTRMWVAYKKYIKSRMKIVETGLYTMDPYKQSAEIARSQGIRMGLLDLEGYLLSLDEIKKRDMEEGRS